MEQPILSILFREAFWSPISLIVLLSDYHTYSSPPSEEVTLTAIRGKGDDHSGYFKLKRGISKGRAVRVFSEAYLRASGR